MPHVVPSLVAGRLRAIAGSPSVRVAHRSRSSGLDLVWFPWNGMTWTPANASVVTVHDVWPFAAPSQDEAIRRREQSHYRLAVRQAKRFIAVSRFTADELSARLDVEPKRIDVVRNGVRLLTDGDVAPATFAGADRYVLAVGEDEPRKDLPTLVDAAALLPESLRASTAFVVAGKPSSRVAHLMRERGVRVEVAGEVSDERLASLYAGARAFVFPSRYEGFGLPVLEAMEYGVAVIASDAPAIVETAGDAALTFPVGDARALADALARVLDEEDLARRLSAAGRERAAQMNVERCADDTIEAFRRAVAD